MIESKSTQDMPQTAVSSYQSTGYAPPAYLPTPEQLERAAALRRFNKLYVYLPMSIFSSIAIFAAITLFWGAFAVGSEQTVSFISALADITVILATIPLTLLCAILPLAAIAFYFNGRSTPKQEYGRTQIFLWQINNFINKAGDKINETAPKLIKPITALHGLSSYISSFIKRVRIGRRFGNP